MCIITQSFNKTSSKFSVMCEVFFSSFLSRFPMLAFSWLSLCCRRVLFARLFVCHLTCLCVRRRNLLSQKNEIEREKSSFPSPVSRTKEQKKKILMLLCRQHLLSFWYKWTKGSKIVIWIMPFIPPWFLVKQFSASLWWMFFLPLFAFLNKRHNCNEFYYFKTNYC